ncbi:MAG: PRC-barrel domain-containing protein [bacterium]|nr:PRC-barrel domain-containing protein [bacterium]
MLHSIQHIRDFIAVDGAKEIGAIWGFVIDKHSWNVRHVIIQTGKGLQDQNVLISRQTFGKPLLSDKVFPVSLTGGNSGTPASDNAADLSSCPYVTKLDICLGPPSGWALARPMPLPAFPMPMVSSFYVMEHTSSIQGDSKCDAHPQSCRDLIGSLVQATDGRAGVVDDLLLDDNCWLIRYVILDTGKWFPGRKVILSTLWLKYANEDDPTLFMDLPLEAIKNGPEFDPAITISRELEGDIFDHYGRKPYWA